MELRNIFLIFEKY